jgi:hypothetical protein
MNQGPHGIPGLEQRRNNDRTGSAGGARHQDLGTNHHSSCKFDDSNLGNWRRLISRSNLHER